MGINTSHKFTRVPKVNSISMNVDLTRLIMVKEMASHWYSIKRYITSLKFANDAHKREHQSSPAQRKQGTILIL